MDSPTTMRSPLRANFRMDQSLRRRTFSPNKSILLQEPAGKENDDDERSKRRSLVAMQKQISDANTSNTSKATPTFKNMKGIPEHEIRSHLDICIKMYAENKITMKNAWNLNVIDYIRATLITDKPIKNPLQVASTSLDVGAKVYSIRVDDIHSDGLKLASNMARMGPTIEENDNDNDADNVNNTLNTAKTSKTKKKKRVTNKCTLSKAENLLGDFPKLESAFFQTQSNSSLSLVNNLFTTRLPTDRSGCRIMLLNKDKAWPVPSDEDLTVNDDKKFPFKIEPIGKFEMCPDFVKFELNEWDPQNDDIDESRSTIMNNSLIFDDNGIPMAELDGTIHDVFNEPDPADYPSSGDEEVNYANDFQGEVANICDYDPTNNTEENDCSYYSFLQKNKMLSCLWAGPSHWKIKNLQRATSHFSGVTDKKVPQRKKSKKKEDTLINFRDVNRNSISNIKVAPPKRLVHPFTDSKFQVPPNHLTSVKTFQTLLSKPSCMIDIKRKTDQVEQAKDDNDNYEIGPYNFENANDALYCSQVVEDGNISDEEEIVVNENQQDPENLNIPDPAPKPQIKYALQAKKMDMKKLKNVIWNILLGDAKNDVTENTENKIIEAKFSDIYAKLPQRLNKSMTSELSCSLVFIAILHLANEHNLELIGQEDYANFSIRS